MHRSHIRRSSLALVVSLISLLAAACNTPTPAPTLRPTLIPSLTLTPTLFIVTVAKTPPPATWTPAPTKTPPPTATRANTATPQPTYTIAPTRTIVGGKPGIVTTEGLLAVELNKAVILAALKEQRPNQYFSTSVNSVDDVQLFNGYIQLNLTLNDFTSSGMKAVLKLLIRPAFGELEADLGGIQAVGQVDPKQVETSRQLMQTALQEALKPVVKAYAPLLDKYQVLLVQVDTQRVLVTVKISGTLPTPLPSETPTPLPAATAAATAAQ